MITIYLLTILIFILYVGYIWKRYGVLASISDSYYQLPKSSKFLFTLFSWSVGFGTLIVGANILNPFLMFFAGAGLVFVGAAAEFKQKLTRAVHFGSAAVSIIFSQIAIGIAGYYYLNIIFGISTAIFLILWLRTKIWWIEIVAILTIMFALGCELFK